MIVGCSRERQGEEQKSKYFPILHIPEDTQMPSLPALTSSLLTGMSYCQGSCRCLFSLFPPTRSHFATQGAGAEAAFPPSPGIMYFQNFTDLDTVAQICPEWGCGVLESEASLSRERKNTHTSKDSYKEQQEEKASGKA